MLKQNFLKSAALTAAAACMLLFAACGGDPAKENAEPTPTQTINETQNDPAAPSSSQTQAEPEAEPEAEPPAVPSSPIAKITGGADEVGIYSVVVRLTDQAADKGVVEVVSYGAKGSPQENSVVNTFRIEYEKETAGTFEIRTFFNGEVYQNLHHKDEVKVVNTFDATLRAGNVIVSYTPDGGDTQEIFKADAAYFGAPAN